MYLLASQAGNINTPNVDEMATLVQQVEASIGSANVRKDGMDRDMTTSVMQRLYTSTLDPDTTVRPPSPSSFARENYFTARHPSRWNIVKVALPGPAYAGNGHDKISVEQWLLQLSEGAEMMEGKLSELDFKRIMKSKSTSQAHSSLSLWMRNEEI